MLANDTVEREYELNAFSPCNANHKAEHSLYSQRVNIYDK